MTASVPWDKDDVEPAAVTETSAPVTETPAAVTPEPASVPAADGSDPATKQDLWTMERTAMANAQQVALDVIEAKLKGQDFSISTTNLSGHAIKVADAKNRAYRSLLQNMGIDVVVALVTLLPMLASMNFTDRTSWIVFGTSVLKTVVTVFVTYVSRLSVTPPNPAETVLQQSLTASPPNAKS